MINRITENFGIKNFFILVTVLLIIAGFLIGPSIYKLMLENRYKGVTNARVTNIANRKAAFQHLNGTNEKTVGCDITYTFTVGGKNYSKTGNMQPNSETRALFDKFNSGQPCFLEIKYALENPAESMISKILIVQK